MRRGCGTFAWLTCDRAEQRVLQIGRQQRAVDVSGPQLLVCGCILAPHACSRFRCTAARPISTWRSIAACKHPPLLELAAANAIALQEHEGRVGSHTVARGKKVTDMCSLPQLMCLLHLMH